MKKKYFNKNSIISLVLVISITLMPFRFFSKKAEAQSAISGYISGLTPVILSLPQCSGKITGAITGLFSQGVDFVSSSGTTLNLNKSRTSNKEAKEAGSQFEAISVYDSFNAPKLDTLVENTESIKKSNDSLDRSKTCLDAIGRMVAKMLLQKITLSTVAWINNGFEGEPSFIKQPGKFFEDIAKNEILQFGIEINNPELFPFGRAWLQNQALAFNKKFTDNARYSLNELIQETNPEFSDVKFKADFSQGGWDAWSYLTQVPANNPLGFQILASNELSRRLEGTSQSQAEEIRDNLEQAGGFLGDQRCVDPETGEPNGITQAEHRLALAEGEVLCKKWEYVTPGKLIAEEATDAIGYPKDSLLAVEDLNDAIAAVLDAILAQFSNQWMSEGFANVDTYGSSGQFTYSTSGPNYYQTQVQKDFYPTHINTSSWLQANPNFNIRTDLTQALIDEQRTYVDKLKQQNKEILSTTDEREYSGGKETNAYGIIPVIYQLDYCIPGPHPGWEIDARRALAAATNTIIPETTQSLEESDAEKILTGVNALINLGAIAAGAELGALVGSSVPVVGTIIGMAVGTVVGLLVDLFMGDSDINFNVRAYYAYIFGGYTGVLPDYREEEAMSLNLTSKMGVVNALNTILTRYIEIINKTYFSTPSLLPTVAQEASVLFNQIPGYSAMIENNEEKIATLNNVVNILEEIKKEVDFLNEEVEFGNIAEEDYEDSLIPLLDSFGRISKEMANGNDIALANNYIKEIVDKKKYIYDNLLKGPAGCEADLMKPQKKFPSASISSNLPVQEPQYDWSNFDVNSTKRMPYPFPVLYDYNLYEVEEPLPDPLSFPQAFYTTMPNNFHMNLLGPGFLSFVHYTSDVRPGSQNKLLYMGPERLKIHDLIPIDQNIGEINNNYVRIGRILETGGSARSGSFETIISIY